MSKHTVKLNKWVKTLSKKELQSVLVECVEELINMEYVCLYLEAPMWDNSGEFLDGKERTEEE